MHQSPKQPEIKFTPLSEGLGFHPFSDGLPYAPVGKTQNPRSQRPAASQAIPAAATGVMPTQPGSPSPATTMMGAGATAAGAPSFVSRPVPRVSVPVASTAMTSHASAALSAQALPSAPMISAIDELKASAEPAESYGFAYLIRRLFAYAIDSAFNLGVCVAALCLALWKQNLNPELLLTPSIIVTAALFLAVFNWALTTAQEVAFGTSIGKRLFGLALRGSTAAIFLRAFFFLTSLGFGGLGILWAVFTRRKRCWHDMIVDLQPVELE